MNKEWKSRSDSVLAQGASGTNSKRPSCFPPNFPMPLVRSDGCHVWDSEGKKYLDFISGLGTSILGYRHPKVEEAVDKARKLGTTFSLQHYLPIEVAEMIRERVPAAQKIRFLKTGSEACSAAVRIARTWTETDEVMSEGYHGWHDEFTSLTPPGLGVPYESTVYQVRKYNDAMMARDSITITEPVMLEMSDLRRDQLCSRLEISKAMIFDEIITGFRVPKYTVSRLWDLKPDIICLGKAIANGRPLSLVAGSKEAMDSGEYFVSSTFSEEIESLAACKATMEELDKLSLKDLNFYGNRFREKLSSLHPGIKFDGYGTYARFNMTEPAGALFAQEMCRSGILIGKAWFFNFAHLEQGVEDYVMNIAHDVVNRINRGECHFEGRLPREPFQRWSS